MPYVMELSGRLSILFSIGNSAGAENIMGRSLYNRIQLGRRRLLLNMRRVRAAAGFLALCTGIVVWMIATYE